MKKLLLGVAALPFLVGIAVAGEPLQLTDGQMDKVTAGWALHELDVSNTSWTEVSVYAGPLTIACPSCFLNISSASVSIQSHFGPPAKTD